MPESVIATPSYDDVRQAVQFLVAAFGFERHAQYEDADGELVHVELTLGGAMVMPAIAGQGEYGQLMSTVADAGKPTCGFYVVIQDVAAHHRRAREAGAQIITDPRRRDHGGEEYTCRDPGDHVWTFGSYDPWSVTGH
ncbi:MAG TPA: VOC family protein [Egibacteraceae bacterium]|nr:VOC family protein [Egibacteraceae bacterium]